MVQSLILKSHETKSQLYLRSHNRHTFKLASDLVQILLEHGANPNLANNDGITPLCLVFESDYSRHFMEDEEVVTARLVLLSLEHGADVNVQDKDKRILLLWAIELRDVRLRAGFTCSWRRS
jgi:ankyrin repeat protein